VRLPLDFFVLYGSAASVLGSAGQSAHAAANGFLDALSMMRRRRGLPSTTIAWGAWSEIGAAMRVKDTGRGARLGIRSFSPEKGIALLEQAISSGLPNIAALPIHWQTYLGGGNAQSRWPFFEKLAAAPQQDAPDEAAREALVSVLDNALPENRLTVIRQSLQARVADVLRLSAGIELREDQPLGELGLDSLMALELKNGLQRELKIPLPGNFFFEYPTVAMAATYINARLVAAGGDSRPSSDSSECEELTI
jgi:acyl carrier protein